MCAPISELPSNIHMNTIIETNTLTDTLTNNIHTLYSNTRFLKTNILKLSILGDPEVTANIYCNSRNHPIMDAQNYSTDLR